MRARPRWGAALAALLCLGPAACQGPGPFRCQRDEQCDGVPGAVCVQGGCAFASARCGAGRLEYAQSAATPGACIAVDAGGDAITDVSTDIQTDTLADTTTDTTPEARADGAEPPPDAPTDLGEAPADRPEAAVDAGDAADTGADAGADVGADTAPDRPLDGPAPADAPSDTGLALMDVRLDLTPMDVTVTDLGGADASPVDVVTPDARPPRDTGCGAGSSAGRQARALFPPNGARVLGLPVTLEWENAFSSSGVRLERCETHTCAAAGLTGRMVAGTRVLTSALSGVPFANGANTWRLTPTISGGVMPTTPWFFTVRPTASPMGFTLGLTGDFNGDRRPDPLVVGTGSTSGSRVLYLQTSGTSLTPDFHRLDPPDGADAGFGRSLAIAGDIDGDGFLDAIVGGSAGTDGRMAIYYGSSMGLGRVTPVTSLAIPTLGAQVASAGDFNRDGYADFVATDAASSVVRLFYGASSGFDPAPLSLVCGVASAPQLLLGALDHDGDGFGDVVIGGPGGVCVFQGAPRGCAPGTRELRRPSLAMGSVPAFGPNVVAGDFTGGGRTELLVYLTVAGRVSSAYLYTDPLGSSAMLTIPERSGRAGTAVAAVEDLDLDGRDELAVVYPESREVVFYPVAPGALTAHVAVTLESGELPETVAGIGDYDSDGYPDVLVGAPSTNTVFLVRFPMGALRRALVTGFRAPAGITGWGTWLGR